MIVFLIIEIKKPANRRLRIRSDDFYYYAVEEWRKGGPSNKEGWWPALNCPVFWSEAKAMEWINAHTGEGDL